MQEFKVVHDQAMKFEGMSTKFDLALIYSLLSLQNKSSISGNIAEFGVFKGKSSAVLVEALNENETLVLNDICKEYAEDFLAKNNSKKIYFYEGPSEEFQQKAKKQYLQKKSVRFLHSDGSHFFSNVVNDLRIAEKVLATNGIVVVDDFNNTCYPQVAAATYRHVYLKRNNLKPFLIGENKIFLCRKEAFVFYKRYVLEELGHLLKSQGLNPYFAKTNSCADFDVLSAQTKAANAADEVYGKELYQHFYTLT